MRRYKFLDQDSTFKAMNNLRNAFLAAKNGHEVEEIISAILTSDERIRIGRRIEIATYLKAGLTFEEICRQLHVGRSTAIEVEKLMEKHPEGFAMIKKRQDKVDSEYQEKAFVAVGSSKLFFKPKKYTGFRRSDVKR